MEVIRPQKVSGKVEREQLSGKQSGLFMKSPVVFLLRAQCLGLTCEETALSVIPGPSSLPEH